MKGFINDVWWILLLRSIALFMFGFVAVSWPGLTLAALAVFFAAYILVSGVTNILMSIDAITHKKVWLVTFLLGIIEVALGVYLFKNPELTLATLITAIGFIFMIQGIFAIIASFVDTADSGMRFLEIISGILGIIAGFIVLQHPVAGGFTFAWVLGVYGLIDGTIGIAVALSLRNLVETIKTEVLPKEQ